MRYLTIPPTIKLVNLADDSDTGATMSFKEFLGNMLLDAKWKTASDMFLIADIRQKLKEQHTPGEVIELSDGDWEKLAVVIKEPSGGYTPVIAIQCTDFLRAILDAPTKKPEAKS